MKKAAATRQTILQKAFELIYANGYQKTSIDDIIATTQVTKGAFYYHFKNKDEMGIAIINEIMKPTFESGFVHSLDPKIHPLDAIYGLIHHLLMENEVLKVEYGCPVANLTQEMTPWNPGFNNALTALSLQWSDAMNAIIETGKQNGLVRGDVNVAQVTLFVMSGYWGVRNFGKLENNKSAYLPYLQELKSYLNTLR